MGTKDKARGQLGRVFRRFSAAGIEPEDPSAQAVAPEDYPVNFLLDTNAVSEWVKPRPNPGLIGWMESADEDRIFISVVSLAELRYGVERMAAGRRRNRLEQWLRHELPLRFESRILPVDTWRKLGGERCHKVRPPDVRSAQWMLFLRQRQKPIN
jgi:hypothetical protein